MAFSSSDQFFMDLETNFKRLFLGEFYFGRRKFFLLRFGYLEQGLIHRLLQEYRHEAGRIFYKKNARLVSNGALRVCFVKESYDALMEW